MEALALSCPNCRRACAPAPLYRAATTVVQRTCCRCRTLWSILLRPVGQNAVGFVTVAEWTSRGVAEEVRS